MGSGQRLAFSVWDLKSCAFNGTYRADGSALLTWDWFKTSRDLLLLDLGAPLKNGESKSPTSMSVIGAPDSIDASFAACAAFSEVSFEFVARRSATVARSDSSCSRMLSFVLPSAPARVVKLL